MFKVKEIKNYDTYHRYGTDWHTDFIIETNEQHDTDSLFNRLKKLGYDASGVVSSEKTETGYIYKTVMY